MLRHFEDETLVLVAGLQRIHDVRQVVVELHIDDRAHDLADVT